MKSDIIRYLQRNGCVKRKNLLAYLKNIGHEVTDRELRQAMVSIVIDEGYLIKSSSHGYKLAETVKEYEQAIAYTESYIWSLFRKRKAMKRNFERLTAGLFPYRSVVN